MAPVPSSKLDSSLQLSVPICVDNGYGYDLNLQGFWLQTVSIL
jgi:hypothetical protein